MSRADCRTEGPHPVNKGWQRNAAYERPNSGFFTTEKTENKATYSGSVEGVETCICRGVDILTLENAREAHPVTWCPAADHRPLLRQGQGGAVGSRPAVLDSRLSDVGLEAIG